MCKKNLQLIIECLHHQRSLHSDMFSSILKPDLKLLPQRRQLPFQFVIFRCDMITRSHNLENNSQIS